MLVAVLSAMALSACASSRHAAPDGAPVGPRRVEPSAPVMTPVLMPPVTLPLPGMRDSLRFVMDSVLSAPMWKNARWGVLIVDPDRADTILSFDADRLFMPASNQKLLTAAVSLTVLGPDYRWKTSVLLKGRQSGSVFDGDILVVGSGDPSISDSLQNGRANNAFSVAVNALKSRGIKRITGRVLPWGDALPGPTTGYGWSWDDFDASYSAPTDELMYNEGELHLAVSAGRTIGSAVSVERSPTLRYPPVRIDAKTIGAHIAATDPQFLPLQVAYDSTGTTLIVSGTMRVGESRTLTIAYRHPNDAFVAAFGEELRSNGISVQGKTLKESSRRKIDTLTVIESAPFPDVLRRMMKPSQNQMAELLFRTSGIVASGSGSLDSARAVAVRTLSAWGISASDVAYRDGSGLSRHDYLTPRAVVNVLNAMLLSPSYELYRDAMPVAGVDGTLKNRMKGTAAEGVVQAKTGTLDKARSLSGYVKTADGRTLLFSFLCNNYTVPTREVERVQDLLAAMMARGSFPDAK